MEVGGRRNTIGNAMQCAIEWNRRNGRRRRRQEKRVDCCCYSCMRQFRFYDDFRSHEYYAAAVEFLSMLLLLLLLLFYFFFDRIQPIVNIRRRRRKSCALCSSNKRCLNAALWDGTERNGMARDETGRKELSHPVSKENRKSISQEALHRTRCGSSASSSSTAAVYSTVLVSLRVQFSDRVECSLSVFYRSQVLQ